MGSLADVVKDSGRRARVLDDCERLIEAEVDDKGGLTGLAVKAAYKSVRSLRPDMIRASMDALLDDFSHQVDPFWHDCQTRGEAPRSYFVRRQADVANALLQITDQRADRSQHKVLVKAYGGLRPKAVEHIGAAMPRFADLMQRHAS
ncbi:MAG: hypothetical protein RL071_3916 [Pseudomonadota bacterium]|jgi:hypothetical protein